MLCVENRLHFALHTKFPEIPCAPAYALTSSRVSDDGAPLTNPAGFALLHFSPSDVVVPERERPFSALPNCRVRLAPQRDVLKFQLRRSPHLFWSTIFFVASP